MAHCASPCSPSLVLTGHPPQCPHNQQQPSQSPEDFWSGSPSGLVCSPRFPTLGVNRTGQFSNSAELPALEFPCHTCQRMATRCHCPFKIPALTPGSPGSACKQQHLGSCKHGATRLQTFVFKPLNVHLSVAPTEWQRQTAQRQQVPPVSHYL